MLLSDESPFFKNIIQFSPEFKVGAVVCPFRLLGDRARYTPLLYVGSPIIYQDRKQLIR